MTLAALENALAVDMAIGGSTNTTLHLPAIAHEAGLELALEMFNQVAERTPHLVLLKPAGKHLPRDLYDAGGVPALDGRAAASGPAPWRLPDRHGPDRGRERGRHRDITDER